MKSSSFERARAVALAAVSAACFALGVAMVAAPAAAAPPAGTTIGNQASAQYLDATATPRTATSNVVNTIVQQVASFSLTANGNATTAPGGQVTFPHTLSNTGNGTDTFPLTLANQVADDFDLTGLAIYADFNGDGVPDNFVALNTTGALAAGADFRFVVVGSVPGTQIGGQIGRMQISALSTFDAGQTGANLDVVTVTGNAVVSVTKGINQPNGASPSGPYTYTLSYTNTGNSTATNVLLTDVLPPGMTYVAGSGRWSVTGATVLTDASAADGQGVAPNQIFYDFGATAGGTMTATIAQVTPGSNGTVTFQVNVSPGLGPQTINNNASYSYNDGAANVGPFATNFAPFTVDQTVSLNFSGQSIASAPQGATVSFSNMVTNTGNGTDRFDITFGFSTFPGGTGYALYQSDGVTPLTDTNANGTPDTGPLAPGVGYNVVLRVTLAPTATGGPYMVQKIATSVVNPAINATAFDNLTNIIPSAVDLTNTTPGGPGNGPGPEAFAVVTVATNPGATARFTLYVNNNSAVADNFDLQASTDNTFGAFTLPAGWSVTFRDGANTPITSTGNIASAANMLVYADVTVPAGNAAGTTSIFFRSRSPVSFAQDPIHDAVTVNATRSLTLVPNNSGQVTPGGSTVYTHILSNSGNVAEGDGVASVVSLTMGNSGASWNSALYVDTNNNGSLDGGDALIADLGSIGGLAPGASVRLFVRAFSPAGAPLVATNLTTLSAPTTNVTYVSPVPAVVNATDLTTVLNGQLQVVKSHVIDAGCDGLPDGAFAITDITTGALPGACIRYEIVVTNVGTASVSNVVLSDATPANTTYSATVPAATTQGLIVAPANGATGTITATVGVLAPGASATITFGVRIDP